MQNLSSPETDLPNFFRQLGRTSAQVAPVADVQAAAVHQHGRHLRGHRGQPAPRSRTRSPRARRRSTWARAPSAPSARSWPTSPTSRGACGRRSQELPRSLPAHQRVLPRGHQGPAPDRAAQRAPPDRLHLARPPVRQPEHAARPARHPQRPGGHPPADRVPQPLRVGLQLPGLLPARAGRAHVRQGLGHLPRRHGAGPGREALQPEPAQRLRTERRRPARRHPARPEGARRDAVPGPRAGAARLFGTPYPPAIDAQGNADCQLGQQGYPNGPLTLPGAALRPGHRARRDPDRPAPAATARWRCRTTRSSPAAPTSRASSASTT